MSNLAWIGIGAVVVVAIVIVLGICFYPRDNSF